jgi:hypothetical protein
MVEVSLEAGSVVMDMTFFPPFLVLVIVSGLYDVLKIQIPADLWWR